MAAGYEAVLTFKTPGDRADGCGCAAAHALGAPEIMLHADRFLDAPPSVPQARGGALGAAARRGRKRRPWPLPRRAGGRRRSPAACLGRAQNPRPATAFSCPVLQRTVARRPAHSPGAGPQRGRLRVQQPLPIRAGPDRRGRDGPGARGERHPARPRGGGVRLRAAAAAVHQQLAAGGAAAPRAKPGERRPRPAGRHRWTKASPSRLDSAGAAAAQPRRARARHPTPHSRAPCTPPAPGAHRADRAPPAPAHHRARCGRGIRGRRGVRLPPGGARLAMAPPAHAWTRARLERRLPRPPPPAKATKPPGRPIRAARPNQHNQEQFTSKVLHTAPETHPPCRCLSGPSPRCPSSSRAATLSSSPRPSPPSPRCACCGCSRPRCRGGSRPGTCGWRPTRWRCPGW